MAFVSQSPNIVGESPIDFLRILNLWDILS